MAVTVQLSFAAVVTELSPDACVGSAIANGATRIQFALRQHDLQPAWGTKAKRCWRKEASHLGGHERSTFHHPMSYRCIVAQGSYGDAQNQRRDCTPAIQGVSTSQPMTHGVIRWAGDLAVVCGVSLRHMALLFAALCLLPMTTSSITRWLDALGAHVPAPEEMLRQLLALTPVTECPIDGSDPLGTDHCVMGVKDAPDRLLITHEAESEHGEDARQLLQRCHDLGLQVTAAFADDSQRCTAALTAVGPHVRLQADHVHTVKPIWGHLKTSRLSSRRKVKASGAEKNDEHLIALAQQLWQWRWSLLQKPATISEEEKQAIAALESLDAGLVHCVRPIIRPLVHIFDHAHSDAQAQRRLPQRRQAIQALQDHHLDKMPQCFADHWDQALRYLRQKGLGKHRRSSNAESGMRRLRRLEKNPDGLRSAATRQHYMQIYQAIKDLSLDIAEFIEKGPQMTGPLRV